MAPNARVRGSTTQRISQKCVSTDRLFSPLLLVANNSLPSILAAATASELRGEQLAAGFGEQLTEQPNFSEKLYNFWTIFTKTSQNLTKKNYVFLMKANMCKSCSHIEIVSDTNKYSKLEIYTG